VTGAGSGLWLALDTATDVASVAVGAFPDGVRAVRSVHGARQHAAQIVPLVHEVLALAGARVQDLAAVIVGDGPGSFTGLRIGWAAAKGLVQDRGLPLWAVPSLMGAAHAAARGDVGPVAACFDALRGQVFGAVYAFPPPPHLGRVETLVAPALFTPAALARVAPVRPLVAVGDGAVRYAEDVVAWTGRAPLALDTVAPVAASLLALRPREQAGAEPSYGRPAEAQAKWEARHGRSLPHSAG
jgi:tRNA threonylcarbamoyl adenosine modification protein YeaZ